jgi:hypothetical protein
MNTDEEAAMIARLFNRAARHHNKVFHKGFGTPTFVQRTTAAEQQKEFSFVCWSIGQGYNCGASIGLEHAGLTKAIRHVGLGSYETKLTDLGRRVAAVLKDRGK